MFPNFETAEQARKWLANHEQMRKKFELLLPNIATEDGLVPTSEIIVEKGNHWRLCRDKTIEAVPHWRIRSLTRNLSGDPVLWKQAAVRIEPSESIVGGAPMYGVSFKKAVDIALSKRLAKSRFWIPPERQTESVFYAQLLVKVARQKASNGGNLNVEAWQWIGDGIEVDYVHMILNPNTMIVNHLDGALIHYNSELEIATMFNTADKQKGCMYEKYFRLDGHIPMDSAIEMVRAFFPIQELVDEYFQHDPCWPAALG